VISRRSRRRSTHPCGRDFRPEGSIYGPIRTQPPGARDGFDPHAYVGATFHALGFRRVGDDYTCSLAVLVAGSLHAPMWARESAARRDTASRHGKLIPRANVARCPTDWVRIVASDGFDLRAYEGVARPTPMRRSHLSLATDFAPRADVGAVPVLDSLFRRPNQDRSVLLVFRALWRAP
jgi:hypothetical protein